MSEHGQLVASQKYFHSENFLRVDLHGCGGKVAGEIIQRKLRECHLFGVRYLEIVYGRNAQKLRPAVRDTLTLPECLSFLDCAMLVTIDRYVVRITMEGYDDTGIIVSVKRNPERFKLTDGTKPEKAVVLDPKCGSWSYPHQSITSKTS
jgi:hypothetical protein